LKVIIGYYILEISENDIWFRYCYWRWCFGG